MGIFKQCQQQVLDSHEPLHWLNLSAKQRYKYKYTDMKIVRSVRIRIGTQRRKKKEPEKLPEVQRFLFLVFLRKFGYNGRIGEIASQRAKQ